MLKTIYIVLPEKYWEKARLEFIPINALKKCPYNLRRDFGDLSRLKKSIEENGLKQPLLVRKLNGEYEVIDGERRRQVLVKLAEKYPSRFSRVPCIVVEAGDEEAAVLFLLTNELSKTLSKNERIEGIKQLKEKFKLSDEEIARRLAISPEEVKRYFDIMNAIKTIGAEIEEKAGRWREKVVKKVVSEKIEEVRPAEVEVEAKPSVKPAESKPVAKPAVVEKKVSEVEEEIKQLKAKVPFSIVIMIDSLREWLRRKQVISEDEENTVLRNLLKIVVDHALRQYEVRELCKRVRQAVRGGRNFYEEIDLFLKERYSKVKVEVELTKALYEELVELSKKKRKSLSSIVEEALLEYIQKS